MGMVMTTFSQPKTMRNIISISGHIVFTLVFATIAIGQMAGREALENSAFSSASNKTSNAGTAAGILAPYHGPVVKGVDTKTLTGKVMCGYQGWFGAPGDGRSEESWQHWTKRGSAFIDGNANVDLWPDVSELDPAQRFQTELKMADGRPREVFSSYTKARGR